MFYTQEMQSNEMLQLYDELKTAEGVSDSTYQANLICSASIDNLPENFVDAYCKTTGTAADGQTLEVPLYVQFLEDDVYFDFIESIRLSKEEYDGKDGKVLALVMNNVEYELFLTGDTLSFNLYETGSQLTENIDTTVVDNSPWIHCQLIRHRNIFSWWLLHGRWNLVLKLIRKQLRWV